VKLIDENQRKFTVRSRWAAASPAAWTKTHDTRLETVAEYDPARWHDFFLSEDKE
jgi:hypothetical protein